MPTKKEKRAKELRSSKKGGLSTGAKVGGAAVAICAALVYAMSPSPRPSEPSRRPSDPRTSVAASYDSARATRATERASWASTLPFFDTADECPNATVLESTPSTLFAGTDVELFGLPSLFSPEETAAIIAAAEREPFSTEGDSTDGLPSYEIYPMSEGTVILPELIALVSGRIERCVTPVVRARWRRDDLVPCTSLLRRYRPGERIEVKPHRDLQAAVTVVVELQPAAWGGLFTDATGHASPATMRPSDMRTGDAVAHDFQLLHFVHVEGATPRYSLIFWYQRGDGACAAGRRWPSPSKEAFVDWLLDPVVAAASKLIGRAVDAGDARRALEKHTSASGSLRGDDLHVGLARLDEEPAPGTRWAAVVDELRAGGGADARAARAAAIEAGLDRFVQAASASLQRDVSRAEARAALARHADFHGAIDKSSYFECLKELRS